MKKNILLLLLFCSVFLSVNVNAQYCGTFPGNDTASGPSTCNIVSGYTTEGFYPPDDSFPCITVGVPYDEVLQVHTPPTASASGLTATLNYIIIDTISNLPCGICWRSGDTSNEIKGNATGCVRFQGTTFDAPGLYTLHIIVDANVTLGITLTEHDQNLSSQGLHFEIRVKLPGDTCIAVDTLATGNTASTAGGITAPTITGNTSICAGASTTLTAGGASYYAYAWSNNTFNPSISVNTPGTYTVTVYDNCNSATASVNVVNSTITPATITANGPTTFCAGGNVTLNAGSGYSAYRWSTGATSQTLNVTQAGNYYVAVTESGCPAPSDTVAVTVNASPTPTVTAGGPVTFCQGDSVLLNAGSGYAAYSWSNNATTQTVEAKTTGNYQCTVTQNGCTGTSNTITVTASSPVPTLTSSGPVTFCSGGTDTLDAGSGYSAYLWSTNATTRTIAVTQSGQYTCTVTQNGCQGTSNTVTITVGSSLSPTITASPGFTVCTGSSTTLDAGPGYTTYAWSNGGPNTETYSVNASNTYTVSVTQGGCSGSASVTVTVGNFPLTVSVTPAGPVSVCAGTPVTLDAGAGYTSYSWSNSLGSNETAQPTVTGSYTVTASQDACTGTATVNVTFNPLPQPTITSPGPLTVCAGGTVTLDAGTGYALYSWSNGGNTEVTQVSTPDTYVVIVTDTNGCTGSDSAVVAVSQPPVPVISGPATTCSGQAVTLTTTVTYDTYLWSNADTTASISVNASGAYNVTVSVNGCVGSSTTPYVYTPTALPVEYVSQSQASGSTSLLQVSPTGGGYVWLSQTATGGVYTVDSSTAQSITVSCGNTPVYYTAVVTQGSCSDTAAAIAVVCTGIDDITSLSDFSMKPNPANDVLYISYLLNQTTAIKISVIDLTGRVVLNALNESENKGIEQHEIKVSDLAPGIYLLNFMTDNGSFNTKFVKQ